MTTEILDRIRARGVPSIPSATVLANGRRAQLATFPPELREAMKVAAKRHAWTPETWMIQVALIADCRHAGRCSDDDLVLAYQNPPPE
ncbi:hypothetical protein [Candidatus Contendibacter odensensis]|uniref:Uncharacterized protein n=1 Tax=Candidatus Contendobacter odensis Run_B_J11 TaxID=1400861 RepID=A0A7U7GEM3_9GAMM|nr:hypothetical protein [Candidatus Contendobacter odensis]CDH46975.1 hypothetical protein BN874_690025 [Candidatus Contendobacter odensis Run_B_J11]